MPQVDRNWLAYEQHRQAGGTDKDFAARLGIAPNNLPRWKKRHQPDAADNGSLPTTSLQRVELVGEPVTPEASAALRSPAQTSPDLADVLARVASLEVDAWIATLQAQAHDTAQTRAEMRSPDLHRLAQGSAEPVQRWDNPDDAKSVSFNLSLPQGLKRLLDAEAKRTGLPASRLVQRLLMAALVGEEARDE